LKLNYKLILRIVLLILIIFLIVDIDISLKNKISFTKNTVILQDVSLSVEDLDEKRIQIQKKTGIDNVYFFSGILSKNKNKALKYNGLSDISKAVSEISPLFSNIILLSDGNQNPPEKSINSASKIFSLRLKDRKENFDISISDIDLPENIFENIENEFVFKVFLQGNESKNSILEFNGEKEEILLYKGLNIIKKRISLKKGIYNLRVSVIPFKEETDKDNNTREFKITVIEDTKKFLLSYVYPGPEKAFLGNFLKKHGKLDIKNEKSENIDSSYNAVIEFESSLFSEDTIREYIENGGLYMFFVGENSLDFTIPFFGKPDNIVKKRNTFSIPDKYRRFPFFEISSKILTNNLVWDKISDYDYFVDIDINKPSIDLLYDSSTKKNLLSVFSFGKGKYILFKFGPLYRISLSQAVNVSDIPVNIYEKFFSGLISYYSSSSESIRFSHNRKTYVIGEKLFIDVKSNLSENISLYINGEKKGENNLEYLLENTGDYRVDARIEANSKIIYEKTYFFSVFDSLSEISNLKPDMVFLENISKKNGGFVFDEDNIELVIDKLEQNSYTLKIFNPLNSKILIFIFLFLFSLYMLIVR